MPVGAYQAVFTFNEPPGYRGGDPLAAYFDVSKNGYKTQKRTASAEIQHAPWTDKIVAIGLLKVNGVPLVRTEPLVVEATFYTMVDYMLFHDNPGALGTLKLPRFPVGGIEVALLDVSAARWDHASVSGAIAATLSFVSLDPYSTLTSRATGGVAGDGTPVHAYNSTFTFDAPTSIDGVAIAASQFDVSKDGYTQHARKASMSVLEIPFGPQIVIQRTTVGGAVVVDPEQFSVQATFWTMADYQRVHDTVGEQGHLTTPRFPLGGMHVVFQECGIARVDVSSATGPISATLTFVSIDNRSMRSEATIPDTPVVAPDVAVTGTGGVGTPVAPPVGAVVTSGTVHRDPAPIPTPSTAGVRDTIARFRLRAATIKDTIARFRLGQIGGVDAAAGRFAVSGPAVADTATRFGLQLGSPDTRMRFAVAASGLTLHDLADPFSGSALDPITWTFVPDGGTITEAAGVLTFDMPDQNTGTEIDSAYAGYLLLNSGVVLNIATEPALATSSWFFWVQWGSNFAQISLNGDGTLSFTTVSDVASVAFDALWTYFAITFDATGTHYWTSPDGATWTARHSYAGIVIAGGDTGSIHFQPWQGGVPATSDSMALGGINTVALPV